MNRERRNAFIKYVRAACKEHKVRFLLSPAKTVAQADGLACGGYFDEETLTLAVACGKRRWVEVLAHEYCHMCQWLSNSAIWVRSVSCDEWYWEWVAGRIDKPEKLTSRACRRQLEVELDCERRSVRLLRKWRLITAKEARAYIQEANIYVLFYTFIRLAGVWYSERPYAVKELKALMPDHFMPRKWYERLPKDYSYLIFRRCLSPQRQRRALRRLAAA